MKYSLGFDEENGWFIEEIDYNFLGSRSSQLDGFYTIEELEIIIKEMKKLKQKVLTK